MSAGINHATKIVETRKRDVVVRIADWTSDEEEPAFDVEIYVKGEYRGDLSETVCTKSAGRSKREAREIAKKLAAQRIAELL